jgi:hypothetical protein
VSLGQPKDVCAASFTTLSQPQQRIPTSDVDHAEDMPMVMTLLFCTMVDGTLVAVDGGAAMITVMLVVVMLMEVRHVGGAIADAVVVLVALVVVLLIMMDIVMVSSCYFQCW